MRFLLAAFAGLAVLVTACGGDDEVPADTSAASSETSSARPLPSLTPMESPCPQPELDIYRIDLANGETSTVAQGQHPKWSPDGSLMSYTATIGPDCAWGIAVDSTDTIEHVLAVRGGPASLEWSPTSNTLATGGGGNIDVDLALVFFDEADDPITREVFHGQVGAASWSGDGSRFAYVNGVTNEISVYDIFSRHTALFPSLVAPTTGAIADLAWSPTEDRLAVWAYEYGEGENVNHLFLVSVPDGAITEITEPAGAVSPQWSPDGSMLMFSVFNGSADEIYIVPTDGSAAPRKLADGGGTWSPDGSLIAYMPNACDGWDLAVIAPDGTGQRIISPGAGHKFQLGWVWAPDSSRIAFVTDDATYTVSPDGTGLFRVGGQMENLAWSPDGRYLAGQEVAGRGLCDG